MSSISNFAVTIYVARTLPAVQFGAFSLAYVTYSFALTASRGLATDPLMVRFNGAERPAWRKAVAGSSATAITVGLVAGILAVGAAMFLPEPSKGAFVALGLVLPSLLLQDSWRYAFFANGRGSYAFINDSIWTVAIIPGLVYLRLGHSTDVFAYILVWGAAAAFAAAFGPIQARVFPAVTQIRPWLSRHRDLGLRYLAENTSSSGSSQLRSYGVGFILGLAAVGYVQAANTLMGPFLVVFMGMSLVTIPEAARVLRRAPRRLLPFCLVVGCGLSLGALAWGVFLMIALPRGLGSFALGPIWRPAFPLILPLTVSVLGGCFIAGATAGLHALGAAPRSLRAMVVSSVIFLGCGLTGAAERGAVGTMQGAAVATWLGAAVWWWQLHVAAKEAGIARGGLGHRPPSRHRAQSAEVLTRSRPWPANDGPSQGAQPDGHHFRAREN